MNICHISRHSCPRALKLARTQRDQGHKIFLVSWLFPVRDYSVDHITKLQSFSIHEIIRAVQALDPVIDLYHYHNDPDWPVSLIKAITEKPVIYDVHDIMSSLLGKPKTPEELEAYRAADGILCAGQGQQDMIAEIQPGKLMDNYPPALPESSFPKLFKEPMRSGLIMPVGLSLEPQGYRNLLDGFNYLVEEDVPVLVHTAREGAYDHYRKHCKADIQPFLAPEQLLNQIAKMEAGLVGSFNPHPLIDVCEPNKLYEYIACGIPIIAVNASTAGKLIEKEGIGISCGLEEVPRALAEIRAGDFRQQVQKIRRNFSMEKYLPRVNTLYRTVLQKGKIWEN